MSYFRKSTVDRDIVRVILVRDGTDTVCELSCHYTCQDDCTTVELVGLKGRLRNILHS